VATLTYLREETFPQFINPPRFRAESLPAQPEWLERLFAQFRRQALVAFAVATAVLVLAATLPALASLQQSSSTRLSSTAVGSSIGATGTAATRVEDLSARTFLGEIAFVQQLRYYDALAGTGSETAQFVNGAREATLAQYLFDVSALVALPYLSDTVATKQAIEAWVAALGQQRAISYRAVWSAPPILPGTRISGTRVTFYTCIDSGFCGAMASGQQVFDGAAACSNNLPFGTRFVITSDPSQRVYVCLDRGALASPWVDIWFYNSADGWSWQSIVGARSDILIVE
jgi:hypothetical protein